MRPPPRRDAGPAAPARRPIVSRKSPIRHPRLTGSQRPAAIVAVDPCQEAAMFGFLIESRRTRAGRGALGGGAASLLVHTALIAGAVYATLRATEPQRLERPVVPLTYPADPQPTVPPPPRVLVVVGPPIGPYVLRIPTAVPTAIPAPSTLPFDPGRFAGVDTGTARLWGRDSVPGRAPAPGAAAPGPPGGPGRPGRPAHLSVPTGRAPGRPWPDPGGAGRCRPRRPTRRARQSPCSPSCRPG